MNNIKNYEQGLLEELLMDFEFETEAAASNVIKRLRNLILLYGHASVRDLFYISGVVDWYGFDEWGWTDLGDGELTYCFDLLTRSYKLNLPTPKLIRSILKTKIATINAKTKTSYIPYIPKYITVNPWTKENITMNNEYLLKGLEFETEKEACDALNHLRKLILLYGYASVRDLFDLVGIVDYHDNWGWDNLDDVKIEHYHGMYKLKLVNGYILKLPNPKHMYLIKKFNLPKKDDIRCCDCYRIMAGTFNGLSFKDISKKTGYKETPVRSLLNKNPREDILDKAKNCVFGNRQEDYGSPLWLDGLSFKDISKKTGYKETPVRSLLNKNPRENILDKAKECVCGNRQEDYGSPEDNFNLIAELWTSYTGCEISATDVSTMMALLKIARIKSGSGTEDSFVDLAGYAACGGEIFIKNAKVKVKMKENENE